MNSKFGIPALNNLQYHLIAKIDDTTQIKMENVKAHPTFDFCVKVKLNWSKISSKNVMLCGRW